LTKRIKNDLIGFIMKTILCLATLFGLGTGSHVWAETEQFTLKTLTGTTYENCRVLKVDPDGLLFAHSNGAAKIPFSNLGEEWRTKFNFSAEKAEAFVTEHFEAERKAAEAQALRRAEQRRARENDRVYASQQLHPRRGDSDWSGGNRGNGNWGNGQWGNGQWGNGQWGNGQWGNGQWGNGQGSDGQGWDGQGSNGHGGDGHASNGHGGDGHSSNGHGGDGHASNGHGGNGHSWNGHASNGQGSNGHGWNGHGGNGRGSNGRWGGGPWATWGNSFYGGSCFQGSNIPVYPFLQFGGYRYPSSFCGSAFPFSSFSPCFSRFGAPCAPFSSGGLRIGGTGGLIQVSSGCISHR
jgi:hypothetical protein